MELLAVDLSARIVPATMNLSPKYIQTTDEVEKGKRYVDPFELIECKKVSAANLPTETSIEFSVSNVSGKQQLKLSGAYLGHNGIHIDHINVKVLQRRVRPTATEYQPIEFKFSKWNEAEPMDIFFTDDIPLQNDHAYKIVVLLLEYTDIASGHYLCSYQQRTNQIEGIKVERLSGSPTKTLISHFIFRVTPK